MIIVKTLWTATCVICRHSESFVAMGAVTYAGVAEHTRAQGWKTQPKTRPMCPSCASAPPRSKPQWKRRWFYVIKQRKRASEHSWKEIRASGVLVEDEGGLREAVRKYIVVPQRVAPAREGEVVGKLLCGDVFEIGKKEFCLIRTWRRARVDE